MPSLNERWHRGSFQPRETYEQLKNVFGQFDAADAIQKRASLEMPKLYAAIRGAVRNGPVANRGSVQIKD